VHPGDENDAPAPPERLEDRHVSMDLPAPRKAGTVDRERRHDLGLYTIGCSLLVVSLAALGYALLQAVRALL